MISFSSQISSSLSLSSNCCIRSLQACSNIEAALYKIIIQAINVMTSLFWLDALQNWKVPYFDFFWFQFCIVMSSLSNLNLHYHLQSVHWNLYWKCDPQMVNWKIVSTCSYLFNLCKYKFHISNTSLYMYWVLVTVINSLNCIMSMHANKQRWFQHNH